MSFWSNRARCWACRALILGLLLNPGPSHSASDADTEKKPASRDETERENPAEKSEAIDEDAKGADAHEGQARPAVPVLVPAWPFNGRFRAFFRRNAAFVGPAIEAAEDQGEPPRSVVLPDNGDARRRLERIKEQIADQHFADAALHLGQLLQNPVIRDFFLNPGEERRDSRSFQAEIRELIRGLPPEGRAAYLLQFEGVAKQQLAAALADGSESALRDVVRRFPLTSAGHEALYRLAHRLWDHSRPEAAMICLERLRVDEAAAQPFEPGLSRLLAACRERVDRSLPTADGAGWTTYRGDPQRNRSTPSGHPLLAARWTQEVASDPATRRAIDYSMQAYRESRGTYVPLLHPLAIDDFVLMRTAQGVAAFDLTTGERLWRHPTDDDSVGAGLDRWLWSEPAGGAFSADAECFYLFDGHRRSSGAAAGAAPLLVAREHCQSRQGRLRWEVGGTDGGAEPALAGATFLGPPLSWQGRLFAEVEMKGAIALVVLDARTGRLDWSQELALVEQPLPADAVRRLAGAVPSIAAEEIIVCPTGGGAVVAVDLTTRSLVWAYRYARRAQTNSGVLEDAEDEGGATRIDQHERWLDGTVTLGRDCVLLTPPESADLHCLDLRDGRLRWSKPRSAGGLFVACLTDRVAVVAGKVRVEAWNVADGQPAWSTPIPGSAFTCGRGVGTGASYYLPVTTGGIVQLDVSTGAVAAEYRSVRETAPGNLIWHRGLFLSQGPDYLQAFDEQEAVERQVRESLAKDPRDCPALLRRGDLELSAGRLDEALATFREAHAAHPTPRTRSRLTSVLLDALRREGAQRWQISFELDQLYER